MDEIFKVVFHVAGHAVVHGARAVAHGAAHGGAAAVRGAAHVAANSGRGAERVVGAVGRGAAHTAKNVGLSGAVRTVARGAGKATKQGARVASKGVRVGARVAHKGGVQVGKGIHKGARVANKGAVVVGKSVKSGAHVAKKGAVVVGKGVESGAHVAKKGAVAAGKGVKSGAHVANKAAVVVGKEVIDGAKVVGNAAEKPLQATGKVAAAVATESKKIAVASAHASVHAAEVTTRTALVTADALTQPSCNVMYYNYYTPYHYRRNRYYRNQQRQTSESAPPQRNNYQQGWPSTIPLQYQAASTDTIFVIHAGFMKKRGEKNTSYKKRFFVLTSEKKLYYKPGDTKAFPPESFSVCKGVIDLSTIAAINVSSNRQEFELVPVFRNSLTGKKVTKRRVYKLRCDTSNQRSSWLMAIQDTAQAGLSWLARMNYGPEGEQNTPVGSAAPPIGEYQSGSFAQPSAPAMPPASAPPMRSSGLGEEGFEGPKTAALEPVRSGFLGTFI